MNIYCGNNLTCCPLLNLKFVRGTLSEKFKATLPGGLSSPNADYFFPGTRIILSVAVLLSLCDCPIVNCQLLHCRLVLIVVQKVL
jgi:hypothetical protein